MSLSPAHELRSSCSVAALLGGIGKIVREDAPDVVSGRFDVDTSLDDGGHLVR